MDRIFTDPILRGHYPADLFPDLAEAGLGGVLESYIQDGDLEIISAPIDTLGVAMYITENGCAFDDVPDENGYVNDVNRLDFYDSHLRAVKDALEAGVDVRGYFAWSLLDNYEWSWGYSKRFGIVRVDFETQKRIVKASGNWYAQVAAENAIPQQN